MIVKPLVPADFSEVDIRQAAAWIGRESPRSAEAWLQELDRAISSLRAMPQCCSPAPESRAFAEDIRQLLYGRRRSRYRILFRIRGDTVEVVHVRHGARRPLGR